MSHKNSTRVVFLVLCVLTVSTLPSAQLGYPPHETQCLIGDGGGVLSPQAAKTTKIVSSSFPHPVTCLVRSNHG